MNLGRTTLTASQMLNRRSHRQTECNNNYVPFLGVTLSEKEPIAQFDVPEIPEEYIVHSHKLIIKQISLGPDAKSGEFNVVQVCSSFTYVCMYIYSYPYIH